jgi:eukaryotic-like serine/threonine-protein kinase
VYSLGVVLYELLTGSKPYRLKRDNPVLLEAAIAEADVTVPSRAPVEPEIARKRVVSVKQLGRALRGDLDTIILKALRREPSLRYASADSFAQDVRRYRDGEPVAAQGESAGIDLGLLFGEGLTEAEVRYLQRQEWALTADDVLWRRTKLGLHLQPRDVAALGSYLRLSQAGVAAQQGLIWPGSPVLERSVSTGTS